MNTNKGVLVLLTLSEMEQGRLCGIRRSGFSGEINLQDRNGLSGMSELDRFKVDIQGCHGEQAASKALNVNWPANYENRGEPDLLLDDGGPCEVRSTHYDSGCLLIRPEEKFMSAPFVLVTGTAPRLMVRGWYIGTDAMKHFQPKRKGDMDRPPAYWVPQGRLHDISLLKGCLKTSRSK